jgi:hypothetical protein
MMMMIIFFFFFWGFSWEQEDHCPQNACKKKWKSSTTTRSGFAFAIGFLPPKPKPGAWRRDKKQIHGAEMEQR